MSIWVDKPVEKLLAMIRGWLLGYLDPFASMRSLIMAHSVKSFFLNLSQEFAWRLFLQPQQAAQRRCASR